jgi:hypothetical protein
MQHLVVIAGNLRCDHPTRKRPFLRHTPSSPILAPEHAQQLSPAINVELVVSLEVFRQHYRQDHLAAALWLPTAGYREHYPTFKVAYERAKEKEAESAAYARGLVMFFKLGRENIMRLS